jgi:hypothetical protein
LANAAHTATQVKCSTALAQNKNTCFSGNFMRKKSFLPAAISSSVFDSKVDQFLAQKFDLKTNFETP